MGIPFEFCKGLFESREMEVIDNVMLTRFLFRKMRRRNFISDYV